MTAELDMSQYLGLFLQEAEEQTEILERELLLLEREPSATRIDLIFRAAHTLKGSSRAMGFSSLASVTHEMENVLDALRGGSLRVTTAIADGLLACLDVLRTMCGGVRDGRGDDWTDDGLLGMLRSFLGGGSAASDTQATGELPAEIVEALRLAATECSVFQAEVVLTPECEMKYVRAFMAIQAVAENGELLASVPDAQALEDETFDRSFILFFQSTDEMADVERRLARVGELASYAVAPYTAPVSILAKAVEVAKEPAAEPVETAPKASQTVRVDVARLDELMNLVGELVIDRARIAQLGAALAAKYSLDHHLEALAETTGHLARITADLQDGLMKTRMMPIESVFNRFPRMIRDLAQKLGKEVELELRGGETELDRSVLEVIGDPLIHILRNSVDHGLESPDDRERAGKPRPGHVVVTARHQENHIVIEIVDDGRGIDAERLKAKAVSQGLLSAEAADRMTERDALNLIFASGFSTASQISEVSGRGVGMDIVRSNLQKLGGIVDLETTLGQGTRFTLRLPLTLAIIRGLLVRVANVVYVLPLGSVVETLRVEREQIQSIRGREVVVIRGETVPLVRLRRTFGRDGEAAVSEMSSDACYVVVVGLADRRLGLVVDRLVGEQEVVIKSLNRFCGEVRGISGATILGDGNVALIVDVNGIVSEETA